ncbi:MAG TPA: peroxidase-related enzyme [Xanthobacteraceae bacterium]|nr:peroxidase-related enzyme [Xanthobacteraceae bacterium]
MNRPEKAETGTEPKHPSKSAGATALDLPAVPLDAAIQAYFAKCEEKLGFVPNVLAAYAFDLDKLKAFIAMADNLMLAPSGLSKLERELIAVTVSCANHCHYCLIAHGAAVRKYSNDAKLADTIVANYRAADIDARTRAMLDFAWKMTVEPWGIEDADRARLRAAGFKDRDIWDIAAVAGFFNMSNRVANATDMHPNEEYYSMGR